MGNIEFASKWPFLLLLLIPFIIILYILKQKSVDFKVASLYLWKEAFKNNTATKPFQKFKNNLLMYLQIITIIALVLAVATPLLKDVQAVKSQMIVVIDTSASMQRMYDKDNTRLEKAKETAINYIEELNGKSEITVVEMDKAANMVISEERELSKIKKAIKDLSQTNYPGKPGVANNLLETLRSQNEETLITIFSDTAPQIEGKNIMFVDMKSDYLGNAYVANVNHTETENGYNVLVEVVNEAKDKLSTDINLYGSKGLLKVESVTLEPNKGAYVMFENVENADKYFYAEINEKDSLNIDNIRYDIISNNKTLKTMLVTKQNVFIEKALTTCGNLEVYKTDDVNAIDDEYDLFVFDGIVPDKLPEQGSILFFNCTMDGIMDGTYNEKGGIVGVVASEYTKYVENYSFGVNSYYNYNLPKWAMPIMVKGNETIGFAGDYDGRSIAAIGFDLHSSQLPLELEFPILMTQLLERLSAAELVLDSNIEASEPVSINGKLNGDKIFVKDYLNNKNLKKFDSGRVYYSDTDNMGIYEVSQVADEKTFKDYFSVNFPVSESVDSNETVDSNIATKGIEDIKGDLNLRSYVIYICLLMFLWEWVVYLRRL
ncbi:MAG: VWA domain-containing protein [Lachnospiraceae bacterium]|nr:VWA domain-containing protein [Lachnospiraceae bacterium]